MSLGFKPARRHGIHYELTEIAAKHLRRTNLMLKGRTERHFEQAIVGHLRAKRALEPYLITQVDDEPVERITQVELFAFKHRPDVAIGQDSAAIEIKVISKSTAVRDILGQAIAYRMAYRFVILVLIDKTPDRQIVEKCADKRSQEYALLSGLRESFNIYTIVGPLDHGKNISFIPH